MKSNTSKSRQTIGAHSHIYRCVLHACRWLLQASRYRAYWSCGLKLGPGVDCGEGIPIVKVIQLSLYELSNVLGLGVNGSYACKCGVRVV